MPATVSHALSMTTPDDPAYENQPQHWNSGHLFTLNAVGSEISGAFANGNGISFGLSAGSVSASYTVPSTAGLISRINVSAGTTSNNLSAVTFGNANGISFGLDASTVTASHNALTSQSNQNVTAGNGGFAFQTLSFSNVNGISFGTSAGSAITASHNGLTSQSNQAVSGQNGSSTFQTLSFGNANGISFGTDAAGLTASHNGLTSQSNQAASASNGSFTFQTLNFSNANNVTFGTSAGGIITASVAAPGGGGLTNIRVSGGTTSNLLSDITFADANGISFGLNGSTMTASHNGLTSQSNQAFSAANGSFTFQTAQFHNSHGISWSTTTGSGVIASHNGITSQTNQQITMFATGNTILSSTGTSNASSLIFRGSGAASVGITNGSVLIDVAAGAAAITQSFGISTQTAGGATAGTSGYATGDDILYHFVPGSNITMSQSLNGASATLSIYGPAAGAGATLRDWDNANLIGSMNLISNITATAFSRGRPLFFPVQLDGAISFNRLQIDVSRATSGSNNFTVNFGLYSFANATQIQLVGSAQNTFSATNTASVSGIRRIELTHANAAMTYLTPGHYIGALGFSANGDNTASMNYSLRGGVTVNPPVGLIGHGADANTTANLSSIHLREFRGFFSTTSAAMPGTVNKTEVSGWTTGGHPYIWMGSR